MIEEAHEVVEALDSGEPAKIRDELGDLLFQVALHAQLARERGEFDLPAVAEGLSDKLVRRHPHVFGGPAAPDAASVQAGWEERKRAERAERGEAEAGNSALSGVPVGLPALARAQKLQDRAARAGFEWPGVADALAKADEERRELGEAIAAGERGAIEAELGDVLLSIVSVARLCRVNAEDALRGAAHRFAARFEHVERGAARSGREMKQLSLGEMRRLWDDAKSEKP